MDKQIVQQVRKNTFYNDYGIERKTFRCLEINVTTTGEWMSEIKANQRK